jgi:hypothetical protein
VYEVGSVARYEQNCLDICYIAWDYIL